MLTPPKPARPGVPGPAARARAGLLPGGRLRRAGAARRRWTIPPHGWVNLHFSLLPAWRGAAPVQARDPARRRDHRRDHVPAGGGPGHRPDVRGGDRADRPGRHRGRRCWAGSPSPGRRCCWPPWTASPTARCSPGPQPADGVSHAPKVTVDDARVDWAAPPLAVDRLIRSVTPEPGAWTTFRGRAARARPGRLAAVADAPELKPGELPRRSAGCWSAPAAAPVAAGRGAPGRQAADAGGRLGPRGPDRAGELLAMTVAPPVESATADGAAPRRPPRTARRGHRAPPPRPGRSGPAARAGPGPAGRPRAAHRGAHRDAYANLALPAILRRTGCATATPRWPPSWATARCAPAACSTR